MNNIIIISYFIKHYIEKKGNKIKIRFNWDTK